MRKYRFVFSSGGNTDLASYRTIPREGDYVIEVVGNTCAEAQNKAMAGLNAEGYGNSHELINIYNLGEVTE